MRKTTYWRHFTCMARKARVVVEGLPHHIVQRGNDRRPIYETDTDRRIRLRLLQEYAEKCGLSIWGYCLMTNHDHFLAVPDRPDSIARTFRMVNAAYARYFNDSRKGCGHLWQERPFSHAVDIESCWAVLAYIERNPVRAGMVIDAYTYKWSSAQYRQSNASPPSWLDITNWQEHFTPSRWKEVLLTSLNEEAMKERLHESLRSGRPMGGSGFIEEIEQRLGRVLRTQRPGPKVLAAGIGK